MTIETLHALGFDNSQSFGKRWNMKSVAVKCSQCNAMVVNGTPLHEAGCPNEMRECNGCNNIIPKNQRYCSDCLN